METLPVPVDDPYSNEMLRDLSNFVGVGRNGPDTSLSSVVGVKYGSYKLQFSVELERKDTGAVEGGANSNIRRRFHSQSSAVQAIRTLVACPSWTHGRFIFCYFEPDLDDLILGIFSLLRSSRSLSTLELDLVANYHRHLPTLLCANAFLESLTLNLATYKPCPMDAEAIALCFSRNSVLKSFTLGPSVGSTCIWLTAREWETILRPFTTSSKSEANVALKELVLQIPDNPAVEEAIANLVRCNTTLEKLEFRWLYSKVHYESVLKALAVNHTLKEFGCAWTVANLKELVDVFIPGISGHPSNTHLTTLKLYPTSLEYLPPKLSEIDVIEYMKQLAQLGSILKFNTTLKHVEVVPVGWIKSWIMGEFDSYWKGTREVVFGLRGHLELMMRNELRLNFSLQSLVLGYWKILRVGGEWQMSYHGGPCLSLKVQTAEYYVKLKMRQCSLHL